MRNLIRAALEERHYTIVEACDGEESLELARKVCPDLVILDLVMPGRSGLDVLAEFRSDPVLAATPVVISTATRRSLDPDSAADFGADRYLSKPFSPSELVRVIDELLGARPQPG
jgi:CheY-like chemotaxis protein